MPCLAFITQQLSAKRAFAIVCLCLTLILCPLPGYALTVQDVPNPQQDNGTWVTDLAQILSPDTKVKLNQIISELHNQTGNEITVVTIPETTLAPSLQVFATKLFNDWDIDKNGVLLLISQRDRRVEIETGYAIESMLPDAQLSDIIQKEILPPLKQGKFEQSILAGTTSLINQLGGNIVSSQDFLMSTSSKASSNQQSGYFALGILIITVLVLPSFWYFSAIGRRSSFIDSGSGEADGDQGSTSASDD